MLKTPLHKFVSYFMTAFVPPPPCKAVSRTYVFRLWNRTPFIVCMLSCLWIFARSRAPVRISFAGGGSDLTHYFISKGGAVINATISLYCHVTLRPRNDYKITIDSLDVGEMASFDEGQKSLSLSELHSGFWMRWEGCRYKTIQQ